MVDTGTLQWLRLVPYNGLGWYLTVVEAHTLQWLRRVPHNG